MMMVEGHSRVLWVLVAGSEGIGEYAGISYGGPGRVNEEELRNDIVSGVVLQR